MMSQSKGTNFMTSTYWEKVVTYMLWCLRLESEFFIGNKHALSLDCSLLKL